MSDTPSVPDVGNFNFDHLDRDEAVFLLGQTRNIECTSCPDFYKGCVGNYSRSEMVSMDTMQYLTRHKEGTEDFLCGKLRAIINMGEAEGRRFRNQFQEIMRHKLSTFVHAEKGIQVLNAENMEENEKIQQVLNFHKKQWQEVLDRHKAQSEQVVSRLSWELEKSRVALKMRESEVSLLKSTLEVSSNFDEKIAAFQSRIDNYEAKKVEKPDVSAS